MLAVACTNPEEAGDPPAALSDSTTTTQAPTTTATTLPPPPAWEASAGDPAPEAKELATGVLQAIGTYREGEGTVVLAGERVTGLSLAPAVVDAAGPFLIPDAASTVEIVYPQLGGLTSTRASIMTVIRHRTLISGEQRSVTRTVDVRLELGPDGWSVTELASLGGDPPSTPTPTPTGQQVIDNDRIELPDSAVWDIGAGGVDDVILQRLLDLAVDHTLSVTVLATGHPRNVFDSDNLSNHTAGRAVDIWAVDGVPVFDQRGEGSPLLELVRGELAAGVTELGSPWDLDGAGGPSFTNAVHQDHLHLAYDGP